MNVVMKSLHSCTVRIASHDKVCDLVIQHENLNIKGDHKASYGEHDALFGEQSTSFGDHKALLKQ